MECRVAQHRRRKSVLPRRSPPAQTFKLTIASKLSYAPPTVTSVMNAFSTPPPLFVKRPRVSGSCSSWRGRNVGLVSNESISQAPVSSGRVKTLFHMQSGESQAQTAETRESLQPGAPIPNGAFAIVLKVRLQSNVSMRDGKVVLSEYARKTCAEPGVLRCDVLYTVSPRGVPKDDLYDIWILFVSPAAYTAHEKTTHAGKLRLWLENPSGGDNAVSLIRLAFGSSVFEPLRPRLKAWKSRIDYIVEDESLELENERMSAAALSLFTQNDPKASTALRKRLDVLATNVGLENVTILIAKASAVSAELMPSLTGLCEAYAEEQEGEPGVVRTGILVDRSDPLKIVVMTVHDADNDEGAFFDKDLATDFIDDDWNVNRYFSVFPDKLGWERPDEEADEKQPDLADTFLGSATGSTEVANIVQSPESPKLATPTHQEYRLVQGASALDMIKDVVRNMTRKRTGEVKAMIITGWNTSRASPILDEMRPSEDKKDPIEILIRFGLNVRSCEASTKRLREGVRFARDYQADVIIGFGGGAVMDMTETIGKYGHASDEQLENCINKINMAVSKGSNRVAVEVPRTSIPVLLIPGNIGVGAEFADMCILTGDTSKGTSKRIRVDFTLPTNAITFPTDKTILRDSRLISPRRLNGFHAGQGALLVVCRGMETLMSIYESPGLKATIYATEAITEASETIVAALREPRRATGQSRDPLTEAQVKAGIAADCVGRIGVCTRLSLAVVDYLVNGTVPFCFRMIMIRITAAVMKELCTWNHSADAEFVLEKLKTAFMVSKPEDIATRLLARAEDTNVSLLPELGMVRRTIPDTVASFIQTMEQEQSSPLEQMFLDPQILERILESAIDQEYEL